MYAPVLRAVCVLLATVTVAQSMRWFAPELSCWITQQKVPASWEDARRRCEIHGAVLASPLNTQLYDYMQALITVHNHSVAYFIGTRAHRSHDDDEVHYVSVEGRQLEDMPRAVYDTIEQLDLEQGDCLSMDRHGIRAVSCWDHLPYICYSNETVECGSVPVTTPPPTTTESSTATSAPTSTTAAPPPGYEYSSATDSYYKFHHTNYATWHLANSTCSGEGAHVLVLNNAQEADVVSNVIMNAGQDEYVWTGLLDNRPGGASDWHTVHGQPLSEVFYDWGDGQPNDEAKHRCVLFGQRLKKMYDHACDFKNYDLYFICEINK